MTVQIGDYVKASFNFQGEAPSDLSLSIGDVIRVTDVVDENWAVGQKVGLQSVTGSFPLAFVECLTLPTACDGQKVFLATENFPVQQNGDLKLSKGDIILGIEPVDDMWWEGKNGPHKGIFPLTMVAELELQGVTRTRSSSTPNLKLRSNAIKSVTEKVNEGSGNTGIMKVTDVTLARALVDAVAQIEGELTFQQGDLIELTEVLDDGWLYGRCGFKEGLVSALCIELVNNGFSGFKLVSYLVNRFVPSTVDESFHSSLSPKVKPAVLPKPTIASKPAVSPKPTNVINQKYFSMIKPVSISKSIAQPVLPTLGNKNSFSLATTAEKKIPEGNNLTTSQNCHTLVISGSSSSAVCDDSEEKYCERSPLDMQNDCTSESIAENNHDMVSTLKSMIHSNEASKAGFLNSTLETSSVLSYSNAASEQQESSSRKVILANSENSIFAVNNSDKKKSPSFTEQKMCDTPKLSKHEASTADLTENETNLRADTTYASFGHPTRTAPARPNKAAVASLAFDIAAQFKDSSSSSPQKNPFPSSAPYISNTESPARRIPKRPPPKLQSSHNQNIGALAQQITFGIVKPQPPQRHPPRPTSYPNAPKRPPPRPADLKLLNPDGTRTVEEDGIMELVTNLKKKLKENQTEIKKYEQARSDLHTDLLHAKVQDKEAETKNSLKYVERQLDGFLEEERRLKENLFAASQNEARLEKARLLEAQHAVEEEKKQEEEEKRKEEERKKAVKLKEKRKNQRERVIDEILNTEKDYFFSLQLCLNTFYDEEKPPEGIDLDFLLGNMEEIADVSQKVLVSLETCVSGKSFEEQCVGRCFISFAEDMKNTYAPYCRNHDEVITAMEQYADSTEISDYINSKIERMKKQINVFDMSSILIRPVQRILKYPLLLNELLKNTEEGHPDKEDIETAIKEMTDVARSINEYKRRKDLVYKYKMMTDQTFSDRISKLNMHSIKKKSSRIRGRLSTNFGIALQMKDEVFEKEEAKFRNLEKTVKVFLNSVQEYLEQSQETMTCQTVYVDNIRDFYKGRECPEAVKLFEVTCKQLSHFDSMKETVENVVIVSLNVLICLFSAPINVIEKRYDKMLDYNYQMGKTENDKELQTAKNDYEAMNAQLLDELPKFYNLAFRMLRHCISVFVLARRDFMDQSLKETCALLELPSIARKGNLMDTFNIRHTTVFDHISMLSFIPKGFNTRVDTVKADRVKHKGPTTISSLQQHTSLQSSSGSQNENQRRYLHQLYPPDKLYTVNLTYNAADLMDISVTEGSLVGVVKQLDPMGNKERWFVDDGGSKGFVPCSILLPLEHSSSSSSCNQQEEDDIMSILSGDSGDSFVFTGNDERVESHTNSSFTDSYSQQPQLPQYQYYYALYDFKPRYPNEATLTAGHPVTVLDFHDLSGNPEWWLVDSEGKRGYVPANYMAPVSYS